MRRRSVLLAAVISGVTLSASAAPPKAKAAPDTRSVDGRPHHLAPGLCQVLRTHQVRAPGAGTDADWRDDGEPDVRIWPDGGPIPCKTPQQTVRLAQPLPAPDIVSLLQQQATLLERARLLFAGNTSCARMRSYRFTLSAMQSAPPEKGALAMYTLIFDSDRNTTARVTIRKGSGEFAAWNVDCAN